MQAAARSEEETLEDAAAPDDYTSAGDESECSNPERKKLRKRLNELQEKKEQMEGLLGELQSLRQYRSANGESIGKLLSSLAGVDCKKYLTVIGGLSCLVDLRLYTYKV